MAMTLLILYQMVSDVVRSLAVIQELGIPLVETVMQIGRAPPSLTILSKSRQA